MTEEEKTKAETAGGYATEMSEDYKRRQAELIAERVKEADFIITTALIPGRPAPKLVTDEMVREHEAGQRHHRHGGRDGRQRRGHRAGQGGRQARRPDRRSHEPAGDDAGSATQMYAKNIQTLVKHLAPEASLEPRLRRRDHAGRRRSPMAARSSTRRPPRRSGSRSHHHRPMRPSDRAPAAHRTRSHEGRLDRWNSIRSRSFRPSSSSSSPPSSATRSSPRCRRCSTPRS